MREIPWAGRFDAVINIFTAFGYFMDERENQKVLEQVHRALKPGGRFLMEMSQRDRLMKMFLPRDWEELPDGTVVWRSREFDPVAGVSIEHSTYHTPDGAMHHRSHTVRVYTATELSAMLRQAGLKPVSYWGGLDLKPFAPDTRLVVLAVKK
jgi:SAM-dependent methyltransferase